MVLDVGEKHQPELSNFDHHQFNRNDEPACALTLLLKYRDIYEEANLGFRWLNVTGKFDSKESYFVANEIGIEMEQNFRCQCATDWEEAIQIDLNLPNIIQSLMFISDATHWSATIKYIRTIHRKMACRKPLILEGMII